MHYREVMGTTNTARLARLAIPDCEVVLRGRPNVVLDADAILKAGYQSLLLYPTEDAVPLTTDLVRSFGMPINLVVPDGSWRQASKVSKREVFLKDVPKVRIPAGELSRYRLRREPKAEGLATFEAISRALGIIEGGSTQKTLEDLFEIMVTRTLASRGTLIDPNAIDAAIGEDEDL
jgi:DTW domain-containing protein